MNETTRFGFRICALIVYCSLLFFVGLGDRDLTSSHEARAAQNAQMIVDEGHWLVPRLFDRHLELQKPPLYYWLVAILGWLNGGRVDVWAVRLPAACSALACVLFLYLLGIRCQRPLAGLLAAFILASCLHFTWLARVGRIDMPLTLTITFALGAFHLGNIGTRQWRWHAFGYISLGLGLLLKGPIAVVLPAAAAGAAWLYFRLRGRPSPLAPRPSHVTSLWWGVPLMLAIAAPWYVWANWRTDNQLWEVFFWYHNVERGLGGSEVLRSHPWWFYVPQMAYDLLPWSLAVPVALWWFARKREMRKDDAACLGLAWFAAMALFLSCMSFKRADYLLPAYPGLAIFLGVCAERWWRARSEPDGQVSSLRLRAIAAKLWQPIRRTHEWAFLLFFQATGGHFWKKRPISGRNGRFLEETADFWKKRPISGRNVRKGNSLLQNAQGRDDAEAHANAAGSERSTKLAGMGFAAILCACVIGWFVHNTWFLPPEEKAWPYRAMAAAIRQQTHGPVIFFRVESHLLMYHLGRPVDTILEWENLDWWVNRPTPVYFVMPRSCADEWRRQHAVGSLEEVLRASDFVSGKHDGPLVVMRSRGKMVASR